MSLSVSSQWRWSIIKQFSRRNRFGFRFLAVTREFPVQNSVHLAWIEQGQDEFV